jgi:ABC-2 type transport system ATP-binding protein
MAMESHVAAMARGVSHTFANGIVALDNVSVAIKQGRITAFIGRNGSGKTTLLKVLGGLLQPQSGDVKILGEDAHPPGKSMRSRLGYISQAAELDPEMTGAETLGLFAILYGLPVPARRARLAQLAAEFGLAEHLARPVSEYSGGLRQRLHLAVGLLHEPELLLLDEPTAALDPAGRDFVWEMLKGLQARGLTIVAITHDLADVARHCQSVVLFQRGKVLAAGSPAELIAAHGCWNLLVEWAQPISGDSTLKAQFVSLEGVKNASLQKNHVRLDLVGQDARQAQAGADRVLDFLATQPAGVASFRLSEPDLSGAYFRLTGEDLANADAPAADDGGGGRGGRRKRLGEGIGK